MNDEKINRVFQAGLDHATHKELRLLSAQLPPGDRLEAVFNELRIRENSTVVVELTEQEKNEFRGMDRRFWETQDSMLSEFEVRPHTVEDRLRRLNKELKRFKSFDRRTSARQTMRAKQIALLAWLIREIEEGRG